MELRGRRQIFERRAHFQRGGLPQRDPQPQVTLDAGSCSSRIVFNVPKAHTTGIEAEFAVHPLAGLDLSVAGNFSDAEFNSTVAEPVLAT